LLESDDSDFDEDPDSARVNSVLFMQDKVYFNLNSKIY